MCQQTEGMLQHLIKKAFFIFFCLPLHTFLMFVKTNVHVADLAQSVERKAFNLVVVGSSPTVGDYKTFVFANV